MKIEDIEKYNSCDEWPWHKNVWFEITYFFRNIRSNWYSMLQGFSNLRKYRSLIWNDRWYDYTFLHRMLRFKLNDMANDWKDSHYVGYAYEEKTLRELVAILDKIEDIEESGESSKSQNDIDNLYQEFGIKLFSIQSIVKVDPEFDDGVHTDTTSNFRRFWD